MKVFIDRPARTNALCLLLLVLVLLLVFAAAAVCH
jgi:hypothetical protein